MLWDQASVHAGQKGAIVVDPATAFLLPLKLKYRTRSTGGNYKSHASNSGATKKAMQGMGHRRRSYGPFDTFSLADTRSKTK